eukprot:CAMPEP_0170491328 /NCGR_PEP_ID=MMETSP0208-20121228/10792_1 /TAXON_ID=197538 /ORGANISM="Strombidium inclinatum, Strain S3" /LENGTH=40 /DNA_ID= /DNA_START= /DNA_END= /DNA_ORIENTATION=
MGGGHATTTQEANPNVVFTPYISGNSVMTVTGNVGTGDIH